MKLLKPVLVAFALVSFIAACDSGTTPTNQTANTNARPAATATPAPTATPDALASAAADYSQFCIRCHKADGTGGPFELEDGAKLKVPSLREHGKKDSDDHLAKQIREGGDGMPAFEKRLDDARINNLVRYIRREFHGQTASGGSGNTSSTPTR
ncbi:MAG TPA: cytochrome c [Pyrinomonadaceae bacterium]|nr:cytochrome c [Pyrinomonadaceae bacterium]